MIVNEDMYKHLFLQLPYVKLLCLKWYTRF